MVAPGTAVREGLDNIVQGGTGALICIGESEELSFLLSGGVKLDVDYTPALLYQLAKMDGAIILAANGTKIMWANVQLMPDPTILSLETGTRHRTAERVSKQTDALVIAISASRSVVSLYLDGAKYILEDIPVVLAKANQALATLDKYRSRLDQVSTRLTALEFEGGVTLHDVLTVLQRAELVTRMAVEIERYIVELGAEGRLIEMQLEETMVGVAADKSALVPHQDLLDFGRLAELLGYDRKLNTLDHPASPRGHRILGRIPRLPKMVVQSIVGEFNGLDEILAAADPELEGVEGVGDMRAKDIREGLRRLQEINLVDRYLQT
jgi:diadenylate cyclase